MDGWQRTSMPAHSPAYISFIIRVGPTSAPRNSSSIVVWGNLSFSFVALRHTFPIYYVEDLSTPNCFHLPSRVYIHSSSFFLSEDPGACSVGMGVPRARIGAQWTPVVCELLPNLMNNLVVSSLARREAACHLN